MQSKKKIEIVLTITIVLPATILIFSLERMEFTDEDDAIVHDGMIGCLQHTR
ncbi:hypothetical protein ASZ90_010774 [hydrocarbon metagenome]|uniref:Uncharacterized protein n=1 Tax=hydrocarbon metagenome TaxID=938273 RepID=A0A0W8FFD4_9ZZZZ